MRVRAVVRGFYLWLRHAGEEFEVPDRLYSDHATQSQVGGWMEKVQTEPEAAPVTEPAPAAEAVEATQPEVSL